MAYAVAPLSRCNECRNFSNRVIESRTTSTHRRRRMRCDGCNTRSTVYELPEAYFNRLKRDQLAYNQLLACLNNLDLIRNRHGIALEVPVPEQPTPSLRLSCDNCAHMDMSRHKCSLEFPEAGGFFASDCSAYESSND
jgi:hypothetical protein